MPPIIIQLLCLICLMQSWVASPKGQIQYRLTDTTVQKVRDWNRHALALGAREGDLTRLDITILGEDGQERKVSVARRRDTISLLRASLSHLKDIDDLYLGEPSIFTNNIKCEFVFRKHGARRAETWSWRVYWLALSGNRARLMTIRPGFEPLFERLKRLVDAR